MVSFRRGQYYQIHISRQHQIKPPENGGLSRFATSNPVKSSPLIIHTRRILSANPTPIGDVRYYNLSVIQRYSHRYENLRNRLVPIQRHLRSSERRCACLPALQYCGRRCCRDHPRCVCYLSCVPYFVLEISRRVVYCGNYITPRILCSHDGR